MVTDKTAAVRYSFLVFGHEWYWHRLASIAETQANALQYE